MRTLTCSDHTQPAFGDPKPGPCCDRGKADLLELLADSVLEWARTPGDHGGNPYFRDFVRLAMRAKGEEL